MNPSALVVKTEQTVHAQPAPASRPVVQFPAGSFLGNARRRRALLWGVVSTVLSAIGLIGLALFEQYNGMLSELRGDLKHFNETSAEYVKKDRLQHFHEEMKRCTREITASNVAREQLQRELRASEQSRQELAREVQLLRERLAYVEGMRANPSVSASPASPGNKSSEDSARR